MLERQAGARLCRTTQIVVNGFTFLPRAPGATECSKLGEWPGQRHRGGWSREDRGPIGQFGGCHNCHSERGVGLSWDRGGWGRLEDTWVVVLNGGLVCLPGAIWQWLETFLVSQVRGGCY